jgi:hypothetical protein
MSACSSIQDTATSSLFLNESNPSSLFFSILFFSENFQTFIFWLQIPVFQSPHPAANQPADVMDIIHTCQYDIVKMCWWTFSEEQNTSVLLLMQLSV